MEAERQVSRFLTELKQVQSVTSTLSILSQIKTLVKSDTKLSKSCHANFSQTLTPLTESEHPFIARDAAVLLVAVDAPVDFPESLATVSVRRLQFLRLKIQFMPQVPLSRFVRCVESVSPSCALPVLSEFLSLLIEAAEIAGNIFPLAIAQPLVKHVFGNFSTEISLVPKFAALAQLSPVASFLLEHGNPKFETLPFPVVASAVRTLTRLGVVDQRISTDLLVTLLKRSLAALVRETDEAAALTALHALMHSGLVSSGRLAAREIRQLVSTIVAVCRKLKRRDLQDAVRALLALFQSEKSEEKISVCPVDLLEPPKKRVCTLSFARTQRLVIAESLPVVVADKVEQVTDEADDELSLQLDSPSETGDL